MTTTSKEHRQRRYRMAAAYLDRRAYPGGTGRKEHEAGHMRWPHALSHAEIDAYNGWVDAFPKFMVIAYPGRKLRRA